VVIRSSAAGIKHCAEDGCRSLSSWDLIGATRANRSFPASPRRPLLSDLCSDVRTTSTLRGLPTKVLTAGVRSGLLLGSPMTSDRPGVVALGSPRAVGEREQRAWIEFNDLVAASSRLHTAGGHKSLGRMKPLIRPLLKLIWIGVRQCFRTWVIGVDPEGQPAERPVVTSTRVLSLGRAGFEKSGTWLRSAVASFDGRDRAPSFFNAV